MNKIVSKKYFGNSVILFKTNIHKDFRGSFTESYSYNDLKKIGINCKFVQDNYSFSKRKGTLRGLHFQIYPHEQAKIIRVIKGKIQDVVVDMRKKSKFFGKYLSFILSEKNSKQIFIPVGFAHGFCTLEDNTEILYKTSKYYNKKSERSILWSDRSLAIKWKTPSNKIIINKKDKLAMIFDFKSNQFKI